MIRKVCFLIFIFHSVLISGGCNVNAQGDPVVQIKKSIAEKEFRLAEVQLAVLVAEQSALLPQLIEEAELLAFFSDDSVNFDPRFGSLDTLKQIYEICITKDTEKKFEWMLRKATLFMNFPEYFPGEKEPALKACLTLEPFLCPVLMAEAMANSEIERYRNHKISLEELAFTWAETDKFFSSRRIAAGKLATEIEAAQTRTDEQFNKVFPDCAAIQERYMTRALSGELTRENARAALCLIYFRKCERFSLTNTLFQSAAKNETNAWWFRKNATLSSDPNEKLNGFEKSFSMETHPELKSLDLVSISEIYVSRQDFKGAIKKLENAAQLSPAWGVPQLFMADVLIQGASTCGFDPFTRKAVYWATIDLCRNAIDRDPATAAEANARIFEYKKLAPTQQEAAIRNLGMGDTWPLGCWIERVAVVRF